MVRIAGSPRPTYRLFREIPLPTNPAHTLKIREPHVITVTGKAFYDIAHAPADHSNRRRTPKDYAVWEIHPAMKHYWEIIADNLKKRGWSLGYVSAVDSNGRTIWIADAHRDDGQRFVVHADKKLTAFVELEAVIPSRSFSF